MRILFVVVIFFLMQGCGVTNSDPEGTFIVKETLQRSSYYISDSCYKGNEYAQYEFFDKSYRKTIFEEPTLETVSEIIEDRIDYLNMLQISLYEGNTIFDCTVDRNDEHSVALVCINRAFANSSYHIIKTLWDSKELALEHKDYDCDTYESK